MFINRKKKSEPEPEPKFEKNQEDNYKYVSEDTVQNLIFLIYTGYKGFIKFFKSVVLLEKLWLTALVLWRLL